MGCVKNGIDLAASPRQKSSKAPKAKDGRVAKAKPQCQASDTPTRPSEFAHFADELRRDLKPCGPLEKLIAGHVIQAAWQVKIILDRQEGRELGDSPKPDIAVAKSRSTATLDRAGRALRDALESLDYVRSRAGRSHQIPPVFDSEIEPNEWTIVPTDGLDDFQHDPETTEEETPNWRDRLVFDFEISDVSPVVKGTWVTVSHVVSLIVDGWTWADILRSHPELIEEDIRTCVAYAMAEENQAH